MRSLQQVRVQDEALVNHLYVLPVSEVRKTTQPAARLTPLQKWGYCLLASAVVFGGVQALRCGIVSGLRLGALMKQQHIVSTAYQHAQNQQEYLQDKISLYKTSFGIEEMARERLGMVGPGEVLVRLYPAATAQAPSTSNTKEQ